MFQKILGSENVFYSKKNVLSSMRKIENSRPCVNVLVFAIGASNVVKKWNEKSYETKCVNADVTNWCTVIVIEKGDHINK